jgi:hypothetical protein
MSAPKPHRTGRILPNKATTRGRSATKQLRLQRQLEALGYAVTLDQVEPPPAEQAA